jgi:hypothetical protein
VTDRSNSDTGHDISLVGDSATTYGEMVAFARMIERRPLGDLLADLPALAKLSESKFQLAMTILRKRFRKEPPVNRQQLQIFAREISVTCTDPAIRSRITSVFDSVFAATDITKPKKQRLVE